MDNDSSPIADNAHYHAPSSLVPYEPEDLGIVPLETKNGPTWDEVVAVYLSSAIDSKNTRLAYRRHLKRAGTVMGVTSVADVTGTDLAEYRRAVTECDRAPGSQAQALAAVRSFLSWAGAMGGHTGYSKGTEAHGPVRYPGLNLLSLPMGRPAHPDGDRPGGLSSCRREPTDLASLHLLGVGLVLLHARLEAPRH